MLPMSDAVTTAEIPDPADQTEEALIDAAADDAQARLWLRAVVPLLQLRSHDSDPSDRVQFALDQMYIAACERVARILGSDLPACHPPFTVPTNVLRCGR
jgi:hypothetical protein